MKCVYRMAVVAKCPKGGRDEYQIEVEASDMLEVEQIIQIVEVATEKPVYQEELTEHIAEALHGYAGDEVEGVVRTTGVHSGVHTTAEERFGA